jgi:hypothetical protein
MSGQRVLDLIFGAILISILYLAWGLAVAHFLLFFWPRLKRGKLHFKTEQELRAVLAA